MWNGLTYTVFNTGTMDGYKGAVNCWLLSKVVVFFSFPRRQCLGVVKAVLTLVVFPTLACAACFNNNTTYTPTVSLDTTFI